MTSSKGKRRFSSAELHLNVQPRFQNNSIVLLEENNDSDPETKVRIGSSRQEK